MTGLAYILSASHSGSTLLAMLLNAHPETCAVGELKATSLGDVDRYRCSCGALIRSCSFWAAVRERMIQRGIDFDVTDARTDVRSAGSRYTKRLLRPLHRAAWLERARDAALWLSPTWRAQLPRIQARNAALVESLAELTRAKVIVDSSKVALRLKYLRRNPDLDVRVIRLIRDGRGVALTYTDPARFADAQEPALRGGGMGGCREAERLSVADAAREWRRSNEEAEHAWATIDSSRRIEVRYEELCARPEATLDRLFRFLGVDPARAVRDYRSVEHHVLGNGMRLDQTSDIRLDDRWKAAMSRRELAVVRAVAGSMMRRYGYDPGNGEV